MSILKYILDRFIHQRPFFYGWEQRAYERRQEQYPSSFQNTCRLYKD
ncbi:hypothetical protein [Bdellovibrio bacteriovorus]